MEDFTAQLQTLSQRMAKHDAKQETAIDSLPKPNEEKEVLLYETEDGKVNVSVFFYDETFWLSQKAMAELFGVDVTTINYHIKGIFDSNELTESSTIGIFPIVQTEGKRQIKRNVRCYNLDLIISVGYRVNSLHATRFRQWYTNFKGIHC